MANEPKVVETSCGAFAYDENGRMVAHIYNPLGKSHTDSNGHSCATCHHWKMWENNDDYLLSDDCPCLDCAPMCCSDEELWYWRSAEEAK